MEKIFAKSLAHANNADISDILRQLAEYDVIFAIVPNVTLSSNMVEKSFDALDIPIPEEIVLCIASYGAWEGEKMTLRPMETDNQIFLHSQATFKEKISLTGDSLFVYCKDISAIKLDISLCNEKDDNETMPPLSSEEGERQFIPRELWATKPFQQVCDDMRVAGLGDEAIAYALFNWRGISNHTEIGRILRGNSFASSTLDKHARKSLKKADMRYYTK